MELLAVFTTVSNQQEAEALALGAIERELAACVQAESIHSTYRWKGGVEHSPEVRLLFKTTSAKYGALEAYLVSQHPYELPAIFALPVSKATSSYATWVRASVSSAQGTSGA